MGLFNMVEVKLIKNIYANIRAAAPPILPQGEENGED